MNRNCIYVDTNIAYNAFCNTERLIVTFVWFLRMLHNSKSKFDDVIMWNSILNDCIKYED